MSNSPSKRTALMAFTRFTLDRSTPSLWRVTFDHPPINLIDSVMIRELGELFAAVERNEGPAVLLFDSADPDYFLAHYDITAANRSLSIHYRQGRPASTPGSTSWFGWASCRRSRSQRSEGEPAAPAVSSLSPATSASQAASGPCSVRWKSASALFLEPAQRLGCLVWSDGVGRSRSWSGAKTSTANLPSGTGT